MLSDPMTQLDSPRGEFNLIKYKKAGNIAANAMHKLVAMTKRGTNVSDMCEFGDKYIQEEVSKIYPKIKKNRKGIAFPTCVSINNIAGHFAPYSINKDGHKDPTTILEGDIVKIELGVHIDGFPAIIAYTIVVNETGKLMTLEKENVIRAVAEASKRIIKIMKPGKTNFDVVDILKDCAKKYNCSLPTININIRAPGIMSYQMSKFVIDGYNEDNDQYPHRFILAKNNKEYDFSMCKLELEENEVYGIDIVMASEKGKLHPSNKVTTIYKYIPENRANLILKSGRMVRQSFNSYRFPINYANKLVDFDGSKYRFGLKECIKKGLVEPYHVVEGAQGEYIARLKFTVIVKDEPILITARSMDKQVEKFK